MNLKVHKNVIKLDDRDITDWVKRLEISIAGVTEVTLCLTADVDLEVEADLLKMEKDGHVKFQGLNSRSFVRKR